MDISEVAKTTGLPASTLRYYEEKGLIRSTGRKGIRRTFNPNVLQKLGLISLGQGAGLSLDEIGAMFTPEGPEIDRELLLNKADELDDRIKQLEAMRNGLRHAAACPAPNHFECPKFLRLVRAASTGKLRIRPQTTPPTRKHKASEL